MTRARVFFFLLLFFIAGVGARSFVPIPYTVVFGLFLFSGTCVGIGFFRRKTAGILLGVFAAAFLVGVVRYDFRENAEPDLSPFFRERLVLDGTVIREPSRGERSQIFVFRASRLNRAPIESPFDIRVVTGRFPVYRMGDELRVSGVLKKPEPLDGFDYPAYLKKDGIVSILAFPAIEKTGARRGSIIRLLLSDVKRAFEENIERILPEPHAAFLQGLLVGERESLPAELVEAFRKTGVTHIIALSGYNITLVAVFFMSALLFLSVRFTTAFWIAIFGIAAFVVLTGASPSVTRAGVMGVLVLIAEREGRMYRIKNALALAAAGMIFANPYVFRFDAAFQLSFLATVGLVVFSPPLEAFFVRVRERARRVLTGHVLPQRETAGRLIHTLAETLAAQFAVLPLLLYLFGQISLVSPLANVLVLLAVPVTMALGFLAGTMGFLSDVLAGIPGFGAWALLEYTIRVVETVSRVSFASVFVSSPLPAVGAAAAVLLAAFFVLRHRVARTNVG